MLTFSGLTGELTPKHGCHRAAPACWSLLLCNNVATLTWLTRRPGTCCRAPRTLLPGKSCNQAGLTTDIKVQEATPVL